jgi:hypothetical protein
MATPRGAVEHPARTTGYFGVLHAGLLHVVLRALTFEAAMLFVHDSFSVK